MTIVTIRQAEVIKMFKLFRYIKWLFRKPRYYIGCDVGEGRDYWVKSRLLPDGTIEIVDRGVNLHKPTGKDKNK